MTPLALCGTRGGGTWPANTASVFAAPKLDLAEHLLKQPPRKPISTMNNSSPVVAAFAPNHAGGGSSGELPRS